MFQKLFLVEWMKMKRLKIWLIGLLASLIAVSLALSNFFGNIDVFMKSPEKNGWIEAWTQIQIFYGSLILPILTGVYTAFICRSEHISGGWKQLLALPVKRSNVYISKMILVFMLLALTQCITLGLFLGIGSVSGVPSEIPWLTLFEFIARGWFATFPLVAIQMMMSIRWSSFGVPLAVNIALSIPVLPLSYSKYGQYYPWALPNLSMSPIDESPITSPSVFYMIVIVLFIVMVLMGCRHFVKRDIHS